MSRREDSPLTVESLAILWGTSGRVLLPSSKRASFVMGIWGHTELETLSIGAWLTSKPKI